MRTPVVWSSGFIRALKRVLRQQPELRERVERTIELLSEDPYDRALYSHKLKGELTGVWSCTVDYDTRILFEFVRNSASTEDEIFLLTIGSHDAVY